MACQEKAEEEDDAEEDANEKEEDAKKEEDEEGMTLCKSLCWLLTFLNALFCFLSPSHDDN